MGTKRMQEILDADDSYDVSAGRVAESPDDFRTQYLDVDRNFGQLIRVLRLNQGLSIQQLSTTAAVDSTLLHQVESGTAGDYSPRVLYKLARPLRVPFRRLCELSGLVTADPSARTRLAGFAFRARTIGAGNEEAARSLDQVLEILLAGPGPR